MFKQNESWDEEKIKEDLRPSEINELLEQAEITGRIEITLETELEERLSND